MDPLAAICASARDASVIPEIPCRIVARPDDHEIIEHDVAAIGTMTVGHKRILIGTRMDQQHIGIPLTAQIEGSARADRHNPDGDAGFCGKQLQKWGN